ncbi:MAG: hypothetical protein L7F78_06690 [Syntrophales bacterium LBB04]|nr:hypothetical protein [Syntrophales bacterium LBB04]
MDLKALQDTPPWEWPEGAGNIIVRILQDDQADESERLLAAELAGDMIIINDEIVGLLLSIASNGGEPDGLRGQSAISLGPVVECAYIDEFEDPEAVPISEETFRLIQESFRNLYRDADVPKLVRRRILEASVRAPHDWHKDAIRAAYYSGDEDWQLTAVFCMRFVRGFNKQILDALKSKNQDIHYEAVCAAGNWEVDAAWPHIAGLVTLKGTDKDLLLAAIEAIACIRPSEAAAILFDLTESDDEDIAEAAYEAIAMALPEELLDDEDDDGA